MRSTILPGHPQAVRRTSVEARRRGGAATLNFPGVDVQAVAKAVLGDLLHVPYSVAPEIHTLVTLQTGRKISNTEILPAFEAALRVSGLALVAQPTGAYSILPVDQAKAVAPVSESVGAIGFASEAIHVEFVNADELRRLIDPVLPGVVTGADVPTNTLTIAGTEGQRTSARNLVRQFDVNWLRGTSFALFVPHRTDSRLIVPELEKVLNANGAPTREMVRLISMDRLNGILAVSAQPQYLEDVRRWVEILDREGENNSRRLFVYRVQNGRSTDLSRVLANAFGQSGATTKPTQLGFQDSQRPPGVIGVLPGDGQSPNIGVPSSGLSANGLPTPPTATGTGPPTNGGGGGPAAVAASVEVQADDFHAKITSDDVNNAIIVYATPRDYAVVEDALRKLDVPPYQVMIEAAIVEVTLTDALRFGVQGLYTHGGTTAGLTESTTSALATQTFPGFSALYATKSINAALNALETLTKVNVISSPKLMVLNNQTASIEVGDQVPILTGSATSVITTSAPVVNSVDYRDTGIILKVTPRVNSSGLVLLDMAQEVSGVVASSSSSAIDSPTISTRRIATSVAVQDGEIIGLGGLISDNRTDSKSGVPGLSRIPILGALLFGNLNNNDTRTELIVLLRPTVVKTVDDGRAVTEELRDKLRGLRDLLPPNRMP